MICYPGSWRALYLALICVVTGMLFPTSGLAQLSTASVGGIVRDQSGAVIPKATVVLQNVATTVDYTTQSNDSGAYLFLNVLPGQYTLNASASGFAPAKVPTFELVVSQAASIDFSLKVGVQSAQVTVQSATPELETSSASLGTVIGTEQVNDLPLNGRNFTELLELSPGVSTANTGQNAYGGFSSTAIGTSFILPIVNGQTSRSNYYMMDGFDDNETYMNAYVVPPIIDALQEFKIVSHTDSSEYGSVLGGVINVVTKSGTDTFHGSLWDYYRDQIFDARLYFLPSSSQNTPYHQNQFGGSVGGPLAIPRLAKEKGRTFFFAAYQGFRYEQASAEPLRVPTEDQLSGNESDWATQIYNPFSTRPDPSAPGQYIRDPFLGNQIPPGMINTGMVAFAHFYFPKAGPPVDAAGDNALNTTPVTQAQNEVNVRIDRKIGANDSAFFRYSHIESTQFNNYGLPIIRGMLATPASSWGVSYVHVFSPSLVLQGQFSRATQQYNNTELSTTPVTDIINQAGFSPSFVGDFTAAGGRSMLPEPGITGYATSGEFILTIPKSTDSYQESATITKTHRNHVAVFGGGFTSMAQAVNNSFPDLNFAAEQTGDTDPNDSVNTGDPIASFVLDVPTYGFRRDTAEAERTGGVLSMFGQDTWKFNSRLTLNFGLRYDITFIPPLGLHGSEGKLGGIQTGDMDLNNGTYILQDPPQSCDVLGHAPCIPGDGTLPADVVVDPRGKIAYNAYDNVGPHLGFAFRINDRTVLRAASGIVYDNWAAEIQQAQNIAGSWPDIGYLELSNLNQPTSTSATPTATAQNPLGTNSSNFLPAPTPFAQVGYFYDPHEKNPKTYQWNLGVQRLMSPSTTLTVNYVGSTSRRLSVGTYYNTALTPGPGDPQSRALFPYIASSPYSRSIGSANYNGLQVSWDHRYSNGISYQVAYTWSKTIDVGGDGWFGVEGSVPQDSYHIAAYGSRSIAGSDLKHFLAANILYEIPVGKGHRLSTNNRVLDYVLGNWKINNIFTAHSGIPFMPVISSDIANTGNGYTYETDDLVGDPKKVQHRGPAEWFNTAAYAAPALYTFGTTGRNSLRGPAFWDLDTSLFREVPLGGARRFEFRAEAFNTLNNVDLGQPVNDLNAGPAFGTINSTANTARQIQLAGKLIF